MRGKTISVSELQSIIAADPIGWRATYGILFTELPVTNITWISGGFGLYVGGVLRKTITGNFSIIKRGSKIRVYRGVLPSKSSVILLTLENATLKTANRAQDSAAKEQSKTRREVLIDSEIAKADDDRNGEILAATQNALSETPNIVPSVESDNLILTIGNVRVLIAIGSSPTVRDCVVEVANQKAQISTSFDSTECGMCGSHSTATTRINNHEVFVVKDK